LQAQSLDFLGLSGIRFGMTEAQLSNKVLLMDSTSSYKDTAFYLKSTRCHIYRRSSENLQLTGFTASRIEYEFCDNKLVYVFVQVAGKPQIDAALKTLQLRFPKIGCGKKTPLTNCARFDSSRRKLRVIGANDSSKQRLELVLIAT
jgi:hypothetical protein